MSPLNPIHPIHSLVSPAEPELPKTLPKAQTSSLESQYRASSLSYSHALAPTHSNIHAEAFGKVAPHYSHAEPAQLFDENFHPSFFGFHLLKERMPFLANALLQQLGILWMMQNTKEPEKKEISEETTSFYYIQESQDSTFDDENPPEETIDITKEFEEYSKLQESESAKD